MKIIAHVIRFLLAAIFLFAGLAKLVDTTSFAESVAGFRFFPEWSVNLIAMTAPVVEIFTGVLLLTKRLRRQGALLSLGMSAMFVILFAWVAWRGIDVKCSCFGAFEIFNGGVEAGLVRAGTMLALSAWLYLTEVKVTLDSLNPHREPI